MWKLIAGGTIAKLCRAGKTVVILDLTRGEMGTRGTPETRSAEAQRASKILGIHHRLGLDLGDGKLEKHPGKPHSGCGNHSKIQADCCHGSSLARPSSRSHCRWGDT